MRYYHTPIRMAKICHTNSVESMWSNGDSHALLVGMQNDTATLVQFGTFLQNEAYSYHTLTKDLFFFLFIYLAVLGLNCGTRDFLCGSQTP